MKQIRKTTQFRLESNKTLNIRSAGDELTCYNE